MAFRSFGEQALHYFDRPHVATPDGPVDGPAAWRGADLAARTDWIVQLDVAQVAELDAARAAVRARGLAPGGFTRDDFPLPTLAPVVAGWVREVRDGRGVVLVRGLPVARWGDDDAALVFWGLGLHLGVPGAQNPQDELLGHVVDTGDDRADPLVRLYRTRADIAFHCDLADAVGLLCLRASRSGGASRIASSVTVHDELWRRRPELARRLYAPMALDTRNEGRGAGWVPVVPCRWDGTRLRTFWHSDYFRSAARHADAPPLGDVERALLDAWEAIANEPDVRCDMQLAPGDVQLLSNHVVAHARTAYEDDPASPRHLLRLWLSFER
jgi:hypothetical protein